MLLHIGMLNSFDNILVVVVVNNEINAHSNIINNNEGTLSYLLKRKDPFFLSVIDASSDGMSVSKKHAGVGMARKIGMDLGRFGLDIGMGWGRFWHDFGPFLLFEIQNESSELKI